MIILEVKNLKKIYTTRFGGTKVQALANMNFTVENGEYVAIMGNLVLVKRRCSTFWQHWISRQAARYFWAAEALWKLRIKNYQHFAAIIWEFVFQDFNLLDNFSIKDNILLPLVLQGKAVSEMEQRIAPIAERLGITELLPKYPYEVSGGQKQRTAVARAIITNPQLILADEPTGALDSKATAGLLRVFRDINSDGQTILMVTHSTKAASHAGRVLFIKDGEVFHQLYRGDMTNEQFYTKISDTLTLKDGNW